MAKKKFSSPMKGDPLDQLDDEKPSGVSRSEAGRATKDTTVAGQYFRRTFTWTEKQLDLIEKVAKKYGFSKNATARWLVDLGLRMNLEEGIEPEMEEAEIRPQPQLRYE